MTTFDERERAFEAKFVFDAEMQFRAEARCNRLLGEWAAGLLGKSEDEAQSYAMSIIHADCAGHGQEDVYQKLVSDLEGKADEAAIKRKMAETMFQAQEQITEGNG